MHRILKSLLLLAACMVSATMSAQVTTAVLSGQVSASDGITVVGANVVAVHAPTGTRYATSTNAQGTFRINNMRVGGPYVLTVSYVGYKSEEQDDITLQVGDPYVVNITMQEEAYSLDEAVATAMSRNSNMRFDRAGAITSLNQQQVEMVPTATRTLDDVITLTPQGLELHPHGMPDGSEATLSNVPYRGTTLTITLRGHGPQIKSCRLNGHPAAPQIPTTAQGPIAIEMALGE